ncbi:MAG: ABC transporter substrate-binding protein [Alphaproteobacteria bacterium]|nr:MAG: ABC transporter substrate-binding protein [Alphaproteobacteria bacterium]
MIGKTLTARHAGIALALLGSLAMAAPALAQNEQFIPMLVYRTGAYAPNGIPFANGLADYYNLVNERDGGINGVKIVFEECDTGYATDRGVECYERLKGKGPTGAAYVVPLSTGITFALTEKAPVDKIPIISMGYGRSESRDGSVFQWNFPLLGTYWTAADIILQHIAKKEGGFDKLNGKKITLVYDDSPYGKEPIALLQKRAQMHGFETTFLPVTHPGVEQKATWLQIRQNRPDYVLLWGWGVMNSTAIKEAVAVGYPREKMYGVWWSGAEQDVRPAEDGAKGYNSAALQHTAGQFQLHQDLKKYLYDKGKGYAAKWDETGEILYIRGLINAMLGVEAIRTAQEKFGKKPMTGEQVRWGLENLNLTAERLKQLGFENELQPLKVSCEGWSRRRRPSTRPKRSLPPGVS